MRTDHEPDPDFTRFLEWQTRTEVRRRARFAVPPRSLPHLPRWARVAALVCLSLFAGGSGVWAMERLQDSKEVALLIERQRVETTLDERAVTLAAEALDDASAAHEQGFVSSTELDAARTDLLTAEHDHAQSRLALDELVLATRPIHRTLSAPRVAGRDFVTESLDLERQYRIRRLELLAQSAQREQHLVDIGALPEHASADARRRLEAASSELDLLEDRLALRASYLDQALLPDECERRDRVLVAEHRQREIQAELAHLTTARDRAALLESKNLAAGIVTPIDSKMERLAAELRLTEFELELLR